MNESKLDKIETVKVVVQGMLTDEFLDLRYDSSLRAFVVNLQRQLLAAGEMTTTETLDYPADWWEHFKQRFFPKWALRRWPCKTKTLSVTAITFARVCPHDKRDRIIDDNHYLFIKRGDDRRAGRRE